MAGWSGEVAARPNEQPIKGRVRPFRESPPGEEENLGEAVYVAETKTGGGGGGGQFSRKRNVLGEILRFLPSNSRNKDENSCAVSGVPWSGWDIYF